MKDSVFDLRPLIDASNADVFLSVVGDPDLIRRFRTACGNAEFFWPGNRLNIRHLNGSRMTTKAGVLNEFDAALQIQDLGNSWDSLDDWLGSLEWLPPGAGYVLLITDAARVLEDEPGGRAVLVDILRNTAMGWARAATEGALRGRPAAPFHVVLAGDSLDRIRPAWGEVVVL